MHVCMFVAVFIYVYLTRCQYLKKFSFEKKKKRNCRRIRTHTGQSILGESSIRTDFGLQMFANDDREAPANSLQIVDDAERKRFSQWDRDSERSRVRGKQAFVYK